MPLAARRTVTASSDLAAELLLTDDRRRLTVGQGVVGSTLIAGDGNVVTETLTIASECNRVIQYSAPMFIAYLD